MADFKGFKQVSLSTYLATSEENRKDYLWLVRDFSGETVIGAAIYFGNRKYADVGAAGLEEKARNIIVSLGDMVDENGEWVGFLPFEEHLILGNSGITSAEDALVALEKAILSNADAISGKVEKTEFDDAISAVTKEISDLSEEVDTKINELEEKVEGEIADVLSGVTEELNKKANAEDVYTKDEVYTKEEVNAKVAGTFKFKGEADSISADETTIYVNGEPIVASEENNGFVYQIGDVEYASNGEKWVKLGFNIDLSEYAKKDFVTSAVSEEAAAREELEKEVELVESALTAEIAAREAAGEELEERVENLEREIGSDVYSGDSITNAIAVIQSKLMITGEDVEE